MKRIIIICQGRTGSTNLSDYYKKKYNIKNMGEVFRHGEYVESVDKLLSDLDNRSNWIIKIIPIQIITAALHLFLRQKFSSKFNDRIRIFQHVNNFKQNGIADKFYLDNEEEILELAASMCLRLISLSDHHCYLYRNDIVSQVKSLASATLSNEFGPNRKRARVYVPDEIITGTYHSLIKTNKLIKKIYQLSPSEVISTESLTIGKKYNNISVVGNFEVVTDAYDVSSELFGK